MSDGITEIIEEVLAQLEIVEPENGQIEVLNPENTSIEIIISDSSVSSDLDITTTTEIITVDNTDDNAEVSITEIPPTTIQITSEDITVEVIESQTHIGPFDLTFENLVINPFSVGDDGNVGRGRGNPQFNLHVSGNLFSDVVSSSQVSLVSDGNNDILLITSGNNTPISVNSDGIIQFDNYQYTPTATEGGLLYSGSEFYLGLSDS